MNTLIINGSPKAERGNTEIFIRQFLKGMAAPCPVRYAAKERCEDLVKELQASDSIIIMMPLYIHAMPGMVMKLLECLEPAPQAGKSIGFLVQSGFIEGAQSQYLERYLSALARKLNYTYLGTVICPGSAGTSMMPPAMNKKLFGLLNRLGAQFEATGTFEPELMKQLAAPYTLTKGQAKFHQFLCNVGLESNLFFKLMIKQNAALERAFDRPFAPHAEKPDA